MEINSLIIKFFNQFVVACLTKINIKSEIRILKSPSGVILIDNVIRKIFQCFLRINYRVGRLHENSKKMDNEKQESNFLIKISGQWLEM